MEPDNRMVACVLDGYIDCPSKSPEACICYQMQKLPMPKFGNLYEQRYQEKYNGSPGLDEISTTTLRNRKMGSKKANEKDALKVAQSGTPVPSKDFSSSKKEAKAAKGGGGSLAKAKSLPTEVSSPTDTPTGKEKEKWEGSAKDWQSDYSAAKRKGITVEAYDDTASDRISDNAGQRHMDVEPKVETHPSGYKQGASAYSNSPKTAHGFGHPASAKQGQLRCSGHPGAHQIGKCKK